MGSITQDIVIKQNGQTKHLGSVAGIFLEKTKEKINIYQAMKKHLLQPGTALALLEAQAATGGIIDPINKGKLPVEDAVKEGIIGPEMKEKLQAAEKAVSGYIDPYTNETISIFQAIQKDLVPKDYGLRLLEAQISTQGLFDPVEKRCISVESAIEKGYYEKGLLSDQMEELRVFYNPNSQETVNYQHLQEKCVVEPKTGLLLLPVHITFRGLRRGVSSSALLESNIIDKQTFDNLQKGKTTTQDVMLMESVKEYLEGKGSISGVVLLSTNKRMSIFQAMKEGILMPGTALVLLEAQAATGFMIDPVENKKFSVDEAIKHKLVGPKYHAKLLSAEQAVTGYKDPYSGEIISLFQAMSKDLIIKEHGIRLLEAQIATGGIIDPINSHRLPVEVAYKRGYFTEDMNSILDDPTDDTKGFFDPNTKENLTYLQLLERCVIDPATGLCLLPLHDKSDKLNFNFIDYQAKLAFKEVKVKVTCGKYMGMTVSLWELLMSEYFDEHQRQDIIQKYKQGKLTIKVIITTVLEVIEKSIKTTKVIFEGIREPVTAKQLVEADIITNEVLEELEKGKKSVKEVTEDENVNMYLQGKDSIAGILLPDSQIMTIYQAKRKGKLMPGTALILLEAQAATGFIIDPIGNRKFSVDEAVKAKIIGPDVYQKLLSAEKAVTGYKDPYDSKIISLFQAMQKDLIIQEHGIRLLEAQIATGGIIDPVNSHRIPVHVAYKRGYFNQEMNQILSDPTDDTKGFFDPNNHDNLTYLQLMSRCVTDPSTGLRLLPLKGKMTKIDIDNNIKETFRTTTVTVRYGRFSGKHTTLWDLINSEYLSEDKRQDLFKLYKSRKITVQQIIVTILEIIESREIKQQAALNFEGLRGEVSVVDLLKLEIVDEKTYSNLIEGKLTSTEVMKMDSVRAYLQGKSCVAGVILQPSNQKLSIYEAQKKGIVTPGTALCLLEAQAATGFIVDPLKNEKFTVEQALKEKVIGPQMYEKLLSAERAVTGYKDPYTDKKISLFQALKKDLIVKQHAIRLLEAQIATGGVIDPLKCLHLPLEVAYRKGYFDTELNQILSDPSDDTKGFFDPKTQENLTYAEMLGRCIKDTKTGLFLLPMNDNVKATGIKEKMYTDTEIKQEFEKRSVSISVGLYSGKSISLWELIHSGYFTDDQRLDLMEKYRAKKITTQSIITLVISTITKLEKSATLKTMGLRKPVSAQHLLDSDIIDVNTFKSVEEEKLSLEEVTQRKSVRKYLNGTSSIAGIVIHPSKKVMSIYEAKTQGLLTPGISLTLLEAQAATGYIIDPVNNKFYTVDEAARQSIVGPDVHEELLSAERAVTGYVDPYTDTTISLFEAMSKDLIVKSRGIRLLETQIATGGIIDPIQSHRLPVHVALKKGYFGEGMNKILSEFNDDTKGFFDPNTKENITYLQLMKQCETDPQTGLLLLPLYEEGSRVFHTDEQTELTLKSKTVTINAGKFKGKQVPLWEVLISEYISKQKREQLLQQYKKGAMTIEEIIEILNVIITEVTSKEMKFKGLRKQVSASELYESKIITKELFTQIIQGKFTEDNVNKMESIQKYLGATNCIAGVRVESTKKVMSIYEAKTKGLLTPGTSLVLLEAQAATGFVIDPLNNKRLSVKEAVAQGVVGNAWKNKLLSAERAVTGYKDPYTGNTISLFQALKKDLIVKDHGIRLLEAQIATGGIIDPVHSHRVPVEVAYQRGYFDEEMNQILSDPDDDTKGFFDPNTQENLTYLQLVERCVRDPITGLSLLVIVKKGEFYFFVDEATKFIMKSTTTTRAGGKYQGQTVSLWDLLYSKYITEEKRRELVQQYKSGAITIERFLEIILTIIQQQTMTTTTSTIVTCQPLVTKSESSMTKSSITTTTTTREMSQTKSFRGIRKDVTAAELLESKIIDEDLYKDLSVGKVTVSQVSEMDSVHKYLEGTNSIAGVYLQSTKETMSIYEAKSKSLLTPGTSLVLLEAQAATGFVIDPVNNKRHSVEEAVAQGVVGNEWKNKLLSAERAVTGYKDPYTGNTISLFQALKNDLIVKDHGIRLLEAQIATGGIIDPVHSHRVPVEVAYQRGYFDEEMNQILSDPDDDTKGFFDPNTQENLTYLQLVERCVRDPITGLSLLVIVKKGEFYFFVDEATKLIMKSTTTTRAGGKYQGQTVSLWDLLYSKYITEEKRRELVQQYKSGAIMIEHFLEIILTIIQQQTTATTTSTIVTCQPLVTKSESSMTTSSITTTTTTREMSQTKSFRGIRKDVTAAELLESKIIDEDLYNDLSVGKVTVSEVSEMDSVHKYLEGTNSIAGVYLQSTQETMSIYEAKFKSLLTPGTSLVLLEAQAATGFVIDPVNNKRHSVEEAVAQGVVGNEWKNKLLSAERAVTGYKDPYTGNTISLFQALKNDLIVKDHGIRLLEAQIATGGIIDPVHSHRVPVEVAYQRGYFDEEMNQILSDPDDDTKGFFDPNTQENLTYLQLVERCVRDPITGLSLLVIVKKGEFYFFVDEATKLIMKSTTTTRAGGKYQGQTVSLWDLLYSKYITEGKRRELVQQYKSGAITIERFLEIILTIIQQQTTSITTTTATTEMSQRKSTDEQTELTFMRKIVAINVGKFQGKQVPLWEVLFSEYISELKREQLLQQYKNGAMTIEEIIEILTVIITEVTSKERKFKGLRKQVSASELYESKIITKELFTQIIQGELTEDNVNKMESIQKYLGATNCIAGVRVESTKKVMSIYEARTKGLLTPGTSLVLLEAQAATGFVIDPLNNKRHSVEEAVAQGVVGNEWKNKLLSAERAVTGYKDPYTGNTISLFQALKKDLIVKDHGIRLLEAQIATGGIIDPVHSHRVPVEVAYQRGYFDEEMNQILSDPDDDTKGFFDPNTQENLTYLQLVERCVRDPITGLSLLVIVKKGEFYFFVDEATKFIMKSTTTTRAGGKYQGQTVSLWDLLYSKYITEEKRRELVQQYKSGAITIERFLEIILTIIQQQTMTTTTSTIVTCQPLVTKSESSMTKSSITTTTTTREMSQTKSFRGIRKDVTAAELLESKIIDEDLYKDLSVGKVTVSQVSEMDSVHKYLEGTNSIAGVYLQSTKETMSIYEAKSKSLLTPGTSLVLLEAQAATGFVIDPVNNKRHSVEEAVAQGVVGNEWKNKLLSAERAVTGYKDPYTGNTISLFQALKNDLIVKDHGIRLLEAQIATGGIIDPVHSHRVPVEVAYQRGYFDEEMNQILSDPDDDTKGFFDPNTQENLTYLQLVERCVRDPITGLSLLVIVKKGEFYFFVDEATKLIMKSTTTTRAGGKYQGQTVSLWDLLYSKYITEEKRRELVQQYKSGAIMIEHFLEIILTIIQQQTTATTTSTIVTCQPLVTKSESSMTTSSITTTTTTREMSQTKSFRGIRKDVTAAELLESKIIDEDLYNDLSVGKVTVSEVSEMDSVHKYLEGTNSIAGVYLQSTQETMSIYEAKFKSLLTPGTSLVLLEAQAATGFVIDPVNNKRHSVEEAVAQGVVGNEWKNKLLSAERAVTGYKDPYTGNTISLFQALKNDLIVKDHGIRLLEAQIATGGIIDPVHSHRVPVEVAYQRGYFDEEMNQILSDPDDDTKGFFDPNTQENLTYLQLVERCVRDPITGLSLLVIVKKGEFYFFVDEATKLIMKSTTTTRAGGKYQGQTVSLWDLLYSKYITEEKRRELVQQYKSGAITIERFLEIILTIIKQQTTSITTTTATTEMSQAKSTDEQTELTFMRKIVAINVGKFQGKQVPLWEVLFSEYISELKREQLLQQYKNGAMTIEEIIEILTVIITEVTSKERKFKGLRKQVSASELYESKIITKELFTQIIQGELTEDNVTKMESIQKYLGATNCIAGVRVESTKKVMSIYEARTKGLLTPGTSLVLLEAQAATGFVIDPLNNKRHSVEEAVAQGVVGNEWKNKLLSAERAVTGYKDPYTGNTISLFQALKKDLIVKDHGIRLLEAQIATGGIIDPVHSHRVPVEVAYQRGYFDEEMNQILSDPDDDTKGFFDPNTQENLTYLQLVERCVRDPITGLSLLVIVKKGEFYFFVDEATKLIMKSTTTTRAGGKYQGQTVSLWDLLYSKYITEEKRRELVQQYKSGAITIERFLEIILTIIQQQTMTTTTSTIVTCQPLVTKSESSMTKSSITTTTTTREMSQTKSFRGIRKDVTAAELLESKIIDEDLYKDLSIGKVTVSEVSEMDSVHQYLEGTNSIAGVYLQSTQETMSIYEAKFKSLLTPGTSLVLLEAQAATGFVIDPVNNKRHSVEEAVAQGVVGNEWKNKLLSAERAVTGYKDPYTGNTISLFQALKKDLIVKDHGIRLLEAQIATGGIIDPVHSHRVPVEVAYQRGYFDEEMNQILSDPDDDTKGFFDPNTQENLTYLQLVERCVRDPITGLSLLVIVKKGEFYFFVDEATKLIMKSTTTTRAGGKYQGQTVSLWDLLYSKYITEEKRRELVQQYKSGAITIERFLEIILTIIQQQTTSITTTTTTTDMSQTKSTDEQIELIFMRKIVTINAGKFQGKQVPLWEVLFSEYISEQKREQLLQQYKKGAMTIDEIIEILTVIITEVTSNEMKFKGLRKQVSASELYESKIINYDLFTQIIQGEFTEDDVNKMESIQKYLGATNCIAGVRVESTKKVMSIYEAKTKGFLTPGTSLVLLEAQAATGFIIDPLNNKRHSVEEAVAQGVVGNAWKNKLLSAERAVTGYKDPYTGNTISLFQALKKDLIVKDHGIRLLEAQIATGGIIDPVHSHRVPVEVAYQRGYFDKEMNQILSDPDDDTKGFFDPNTQENLTYLQLVERCVRDPITGLSLLVIVKKGEFYFFVDEATKLIMKSTTTTRAGGKYQGQTVSLWDLLYSKYITEEKRRELVQQYGSGAITIERFLEIILTIIQQQTTSITTTTTTTEMSQTKCTDEQTELTFMRKIVAINVGKFQGKQVPLWEVLFSEYISELKREQLLQQYKNGAMTIEEIIEILTVIITEVTSKERKFKGLRKQVSASELYESKIITKELFTQIIQGELTEDNVNKMESIQKYLGATNCIAGVRVESTKKVMSIYEAKNKGLLTPGTSLVLLEAQAATGFVVDPLNNKKHSVEEAVAQGVVGNEWKNKLLSAERAVTGYKDPYTGNTISLFQALKKDLIVKDHGIRLLEAQIATGGIIDPVHSHRVPVEVAYQRGYFDEEMNQILSDPDDDTKGFFDPNTQENLTYLQLVERCVRDPITGLSLLVIVKKGEFYFFVDEATKLIMKSTTTTRAGGKYQGQTVSLWDLLYSKYITEEKRRELVQQYKSGAITIERFLEIILTIIQQQTTSITTTTATTEMNQTKSFRGIRKDVTAAELLESKIIDEDLYKDLSVGKVTVSQVSEMDSVHKYLEGTNSIAGVYLQSTQETMSIYEAKFKSLLTPGTSLVLLEAQAATGFVIDPVNNKRHSVEEAVAQGVVGNEWKNKLLSAERAVTGYKDPYTGNTISLFQALKKDLIVKDHGIRLLEAQIATGGIIDPVHSHRVPVEVAYQRGYFDEEMNQILSDPDDDTKGFFDPNTQENLTYLQLVERCVRDPITGLSLLVIVKKGEFYFFVDEATKLIMKSTTTTRAGGKFQGQTVSLWDLLYSKYFTEEKRRELVQQYKSGAITIERFLEIILTIIQQQTTTTTTSTIVTCQPLVTKSESSMTKSSITTTTTTREMSQTKSFRGIRKDVTAAELLESKIIDEDLYKDLSVGKVTVSQVSEMDSVHKYLEGTNSIAGVYLQSTQETMSIYEAKSKSLLTPGTSLVLLEAQAATGFVIDPVNNKRHSVEEAVAQGVVGNEWKNKLLSAERAVTGYKDPYTGNTISLFQALKKDLIVKDHGIRLLEAQIATGGIIDPVHSHRVPVEVAYQRGYFDEEMNQILSDPDDDTKGFFDPNTQENLTYLQLVERCVRDPITGLSLLVIVKKGEFYFFVDEATKLIMKSTATTRAGGKYQGQTVSLWDLLYSKYITEEKRRELVQQYKSGAITIERFLEIILTIIQQQTTTTTTSTIVTCQPLVTKSESSMTKSSITTTTTTREISQTKSFRGIRKYVTAAELLESKIIDEDLYKDLSVGKVTVSQVSEMDSVHKYLEGTNSIAGVYLQSTQETMSIYEAKSKSLLTPGTSLVLLEAQAATGFVIDPVNNKRHSVEEAVAQGVVGNEWKNKLLSAERAVTGYKDPYTGNTISLFQALKKDLIVKDHGIRLLEAQVATGGIIDPVHSHRVPVEVAYQRGYFDEEMNQILSDPDDDTKGFFDPNTQENLTYLQLVERCVRDPITGLSLLVIVKKGEFYFFVDEATKLIMKSTATTRAGGKYQGQTVSLWDLLYSKYITEEKRRELVQQYKSGAITIERFLEIILTIIQQQTTTTTTSTIVTCQPLVTKSESSMTKSSITTTTTTREISQTKSFRGIRKYVTAAELLESKIIDEDLYKDLSVGKVTVSQVSEMDSVHKYLEGTNSIAGVYLQSTQETMSIYEAKSKSLLTPGTSLVLLEAQAATGFVIDPVNNKRHSVEEAVAQGVVGNEWKNKLLSAERAVTGYKDPYTGNTISLFQALKKDLIVKDHGIRLLEAQVATGGIIDPVHSHRVPVEVAYQRGYFDEEMNQILSDPDDDTKGFFDPNTQENLTYLQLVERCVRDPITGLSLLVIVKKGEFYFFVDEATKLIMKSTTTTRAGGKYQGQTVSLWDLLHSKYITEEKRRQLVQQYKSGAITIERFLEIILTIIQQQTTSITTTTTTTEMSQTKSTDEQTELTFMSKIVAINAGTFQGKQVPLWEVLFSEYISEQKRKQLLQQYRNGAITIEEIIEILTVIITEVTSKERKFKGLRKQVSASELYESKIITKELFRQIIQGEFTEDNVNKMESIQKYLGATNCIAGVRVESTKKVMSIYEAKNRGLLTPGTSLVLLEAQAATGFIIDPLNNKRHSVEEAVAQGVVGNAWKNKLLSAERAVTGYKDPCTGNTISLFQALKMDLIVKDHGIRLLEAQIATGGIIDPVHSHRVPVEVAYQRGYFDEEMNQILSDPDDDTKGFFDPNTQENLTYIKLLERCVRDPKTGLSLLPLKRCK